MIRLPDRAHRLVCVVSFCLLVAPALAHAQEDDAFKQGLEARGDRRWPDVVKFMRSAINADPKESTRKVRTGGLLGAFGGGTEYMPHYLLGEALFEMQDCAGAVEAWTVSEQQGVVRSNSDYASKIASGYKTCAARGVLLPSQYTPLYLRTRQSYVDASALFQRVQDLRDANKDVWRPEFTDQVETARRELAASQTRLVAATKSRSAADFDEVRAASERAVAVLRPLETRLNAAIDTLSVVQRQSRDIEQLIAAAETNDRAVDALKVALTAPLEASRKDGREQLSQARERLGLGQRTQNPTAVAEAARLAESASTILGQVLDQARRLARGVFERQFADVVAAANEAFAFIDSSFATLERLALEKAAAVKPEMAAERDALRQQVDALRRRFERAQKAEDLGAVREAARLTSQALVALDGLIKAFGPVTLQERGVHAALEQGARLFFGAEYQKALAALDAISGLTDLPLQLHVHLFRAAALYGLYVLSGETNQALRTDALAEIARCKQLNSTFLPDPRTFAPRFIEFYRSAP